MNDFVKRARSLLSTLSFALCVSAALAGCKGGDGGGDSSVSAPATSTPTTPAPAPTTPTTPPTPANTAPSISGTAIASINVSTPYSFTPAASDADGDTLTFQIQNKPSWATFNTVTGQLSGTPTAAASHTNIIISASDGQASASLPGFTITVTTPQAQTGSATLSWTAPTQNTDGTSLTNLAGFVINYGTSSAALTQSVRISNASVSTYVFDELPAGTYYFAVKAYTSSEAESAPSTVVSKIIG